jgi:uncharacterized surface protein with fasciclin (FAS1) repeats
MSATALLSNGVSLMNAQTLFALAGVICFAGVAVAQDKKVEPAPAGQPAKVEVKNIVATAMSTGMHGTLVEAVKAAGLVEMLSDPKATYTVFAPTDEAFNKVGKDKVAALLKDKKALTNVLQFHVISGKAVMAKDVVTMKESVPTVQGSKFMIKVEKDKVSIGNKVAMANVIKTDVACSNGVIHVIDAVLMPEAGETKKEEGKKEEKKEEKKGS